MTITSKGYDPELGKKFLEDSKGYVIGRAPSSPQRSDEQIKSDWLREHGTTPDAQQLHDAQLSPTSSAPQTAAKESLASRMARMTPEQMGKLYDDLM